MRKILLVLITVLFFTACTSVEKGSTIDKSIDYLMNNYIEGLLKADANKIKSLMPSFVVISELDEYSEEYLSEKLNYNKETYGDDFKIDYEIAEKEELNEEQLGKLNELIQISFNTTETMISGYYISGSINYTGSISSGKEDFSAYYGKYNDNWYLLLN